MTLRVPSVRREDCAGSADDATINENRKLPDEVQLAKSDIFWPEGNFYFVRGEFIWSKTEGWKKYYEVKREDSQFKTAEEAMAAWEGSEP